MGEEVTTIMVMKVDLQCHRCYKKVKKVICKFPQIRDQIYDEKQNTVTIKVVCCSPEKIKQKIIYKGGDSIKSIEIKPPPKPKPAEKPKEAEQKPKEKPAADSKPAEKPKEAEQKPKEKPAADPKPAEKPKDNPAKDAKPSQISQPAPLISVPYYPQTYATGVSYCRPCYEGYGWGPCHHGGPSPSIIEEYHVIGRPVYDSYGGGGGYEPRYVSRGDYYSSEENPSSTCIIM